MALLAPEPIKEESVLATRVQRGDGDRALVAFHGHHVGPISVLELDHKGVKMALGHSPGEV